MPVQGRTAPDWETLRTTWDDPEAQEYLSRPLQLPLPTSGPLHDLIAKSKKLLSLRRQMLLQMPKAVAEQAKSRGCIALLVKLMHWAQQRPCMELHGLETHEASSSGSLWWLVASALAAIVSTLAQRESQDTRCHWDCMQQFMQVPGKLRCRSMPWP